MESRRGRRSEDQLPFQGQASPVRASISEKGNTNRTNFMSESFVEVQCCCLAEIQAAG